MEEAIKSRVYIWVNEEDYITRIEGEYTLPSDLTGAILIDEGDPSDRYNLAQTHYLDKPLIDDNGKYKYKYANGEIKEV